MGQRRLVSFMRTIFSIAQHSSVLLTDVCFYGLVSFLASRVLRHAITTLQTTTSSGQGCARWACRNMSFLLKLPVSPTLTSAALLAFEGTKMKHLPLNYGLDSDE